MKNKSTAKDIDVGAELDLILNDSEEFLKLSKNISYVLDRFKYMEAVNKNDLYDLVYYNSKLSALYEKCSKDKLGISVNIEEILDSINRLLNNLDESTLATILENNNIYDKFIPRDEDVECSRKREAKKAIKKMKFTYCKIIFDKVKDSISTPLTIALVSACLYIFIMLYAEFEADVFKTVIAEVIMLAVVLSAASFKLTSRMFKGLKQLDKIYKESSDRVLEINDAMKAYQLIDEKRHTDSHLHAGLLVEQVNKDLLIKCSDRTEIAVAIKNRASDNLKRAFDQVIKLASWYSEQLRKDFINKFVSEVTYEDLDKVNEYTREISELIDEMNNQNSKLKGSKGITNLKCLASLEILSEKGDELLDRLYSDVPRLIDLRNNTYE
jgi:hypothetical protein